MPPPRADEMSVIDRKCVIDLTPDEKFEKQKGGGIATTTSRSAALDLTKYIGTPFGARAKNFGNGSDTGGERHSIRPDKGAQNSSGCSLLSRIRPQAHRSLAQVTFDHRGDWEGTGHMPC